MTENNIVQSIANRSDFIFMNRPVQFSNWNNNGFRVIIPCIVLCHKATNIAVAYPCYERWYIPWAKTGSNKSETFRKMARVITAFLNYLLLNTAATNLSMVTLKDIISFIQSYRNTNNGKPRSPLNWETEIGYVYSFLTTFHKYNHATLDFSYDPADLYREQSYIYIRHGRAGKRRKSICNYYGVSRPKGGRKKLRFLPEEFLDILIQIAQAYDSMLVLPIVLQSYAGLREGEVVNLTRSSIDIRHSGFGYVNKIVLDVSKPAPFALSHTGVCEFGKIKVPRHQEVYPGFIEKTVSHIMAHYKLLEQMNKPYDPSAPLFFNKRGGALTVKAYSDRVKSLFKSHFLPVLLKLNEHDGEHFPYLEYYEAYCKEYPGAHMFRHWFTMYLITHMPHTPNQDIVDMVAKWRGDSSRESMLDYIHANAVVIDTFQKAIINYQRSWIGEVL